MVDYPGAEEHFVPRNFMFDSNACKVLVIHKTGGDATPQAVYNTFLASGNPGKSVHYAIGTDGTIWQFVPEALGAGGNCCVEAGHDPFWTPYVNEFGNLNLCTISIEHCDASLTNSTPCPQAQLDASFKLVLHLAQKYNIAPDHIKTHRSIDPLSRAHCPGNYPFDDLIAYVQRGGMPSSVSSSGVPQGWSDDGQTLTAPNGHRVVLGFREHILSASSWDAANQPLGEEYHTNQVLLYDPSKGAGQVQLFRDTMLWYTTAQGVVQEPSLGLEIQAAYNKIGSQPSTLLPQSPVDVAKVVAAIRALQVDGDAAIAQILNMLNAL